MLIRRVRLKQALLSRLATPVHTVKGLPQPSPAPLDKSLLNLWSPPQTNNLQVADLLLEAFMTREMKIKEPHKTPLAPLAP